MLQKAGFSPAEVDEIVTTIIAPHSCYPENMPQTLDAKVVATADAFGHLGTEFYTYMTPEKLKQFGLEMTPEQHKQWVLKKIERDFRSKIFFENVRAELQSAYESTKQLFS